MDLTGDDRAMIYGAPLWMADKLQSDRASEKSVGHKGKRAFEDC
jgi:hypothetical protein